VGEPRRTRLAVVTFRPDAGVGKRVEVEMIAALGFIWWLLIVFFWVVFLAITMALARSKGHSPLLWGILAVFLPLITVIILLVLPDRTRSANPA
jgi:Na+-translocating ferredoxin:NAD+ oxidoreductase RnfA subunit